MLNAGRPSAVLIGSIQVWFEDLTPCTYFSLEVKFVAIGWLHRDKPFATGLVDRTVYDALVEMREHRLDPLTYLGVHYCDLCRSGDKPRGSSNLLVPGDGVLYVAPELIVHYISGHRYAPPDVFCRAVLASPPVRSREYAKAVSQFDAPGMLGVLLRELRRIKPRRTS
jgi:hypothetical protein